MVSLTRIIGSNFISDYDDAFITNSSAAYNQYDVGIFLILNLFLFYPMFSVVNLIKQEINKSQTEIILKDLVVIPIVFLIVFMLACELPHAFQVESTSTMDFMVILLVILMIFLYYWTFRILQKQNDYIKKEIQSKVLINSFRKRTEDIKTYRNLRHSIQHELSTLSMNLADKGEDLNLEKLHKYSTEVSDKISESITLNPILNSILMEYKKTLEEQNINSNFKVMVAEKFNIDDYDLIDLINSILKNAIGLQKNLDKKSISLTIKQRNNFVLFQCSCNYNPLNLSSRSSLKRLNLGKKVYGIKPELQAINTITKKYNGRFRVDVDENKVTITSNLVLGNKK